MSSKDTNRTEFTAAWRLDFVAASSVAEGQSSTVLRPVGPIGVNLNRASEAEILGERVARGEVSTAALDSEIERIKALATPYNRWVMVAAAACTAAFFSQIPGGDWGALGIAFVAAGIGQFLAVPASGQEACRRSRDSCLWSAFGVYCLCRAAAGFEPDGTGDPDCVGHLHGPGSPVDQWIC